MGTDGLRVYCCGVPGKKRGNGDCHWCPSLRCSRSPFSGDTVGFHSSTPFKVRHELLKTYFGQGN